MGLDYWEREPFKLDAAMLGTNWRRIGTYPCPIVVAIQHENHWQGFDEEIVNLLHIRSPLKVGITYVSVPKERGQAQKTIQANASEIWHRISKHVLEDSTTDYLFLLGVASEATTSIESDLEWFSLMFTAQQDPASRSWVALEQGRQR
jgi:hypothetical protein